MSLSFFDILKFECENPSEYGFSKTYFLSSVSDKVKFVDSEEAALKIRNKGVLIKVENYPLGLELIRGFEGKESVFLLDLSEIVNSSGGKRASIIKRMRNFARMCIKYKVRFAMASFAENEEEMRNADELLHLGFLLGLNLGEGRKALNQLGTSLQ
ncbi:MAG: hypothetical protein GY852_09215 [bacterium]|nr:hypothetical protein [bacterium]